MQHAERLCDRLLLLAGGRKVFEGTQDEARQALPSRLTLTARSDPESLPGVAEAIELASPEAGWRSFDVKLRPGESAAGLLEHCTTNAWPLREFNVSAPTLHEVFIHFVGAEKDTAS
jgi:ABC-2 type transport system ATP-binding protein